MQSETSSTYIASPEAHSSAYALVSVPSASWRQLLPAHRIHVVAKTPLMIALGVFVSGGRFDNPVVGATMLLAGALWTILYAINEATDVTLEQRLIVAQSVWRLLFTLCGAVCLIAAFLSPKLGLLCAGMALGQFAYCVPPVRLKRQWWAVLLLSGMLNPVLRLECGAMWGAHSVPQLAYFTFVMLHLGASIRSRVLLRERDAKLAYLIAPPRTEWAGMACTCLGFLGAYGLCWQGVMPRMFVVFTTIAALFSVYAWSGRIGNISRLREGWLWFAVLALIACAVLYFNRA